jgi:death-on-curing family protein
MIRYFDITACVQFGFPFILDELTQSEPAPDYLSETNGMKELGKVLAFVQSDEYYSSFSEKSAYLICSIAGSQYFSNGNKRLSIVILLMFLLKNDVSTNQPERL